MKVVKSEIETAHTNVEMKIFGMLWLLPELVGELALIVLSLVD